LRGGIHPGKPLNLKGLDRGKGHAHNSGMKEPANDNDIFQGKSPFKGFRMEAVDWPENVIDLWRGGRNSMIGY
jgi:hypothetical protein